MSQSVTHHTDSGPLLLDILPACDSKTNWHSLAIQFQDALQKSQDLESIFLTTMAQNLDIRIYPLTTENSPIPIEWLDGKSFEKEILTFLHSYDQHPDTGAIWPIPHNNKEFSWIMKIADKTLWKTGYLECTEEQDINRFLREKFLNILSAERFSFQFKYEPFVTFFNAQSNVEDNLLSSPKIPHIDSSFACIALWKERGTVLFKHEDFKAVQMGSRKRMIPDKAGIVEGYEAQSPAFLIIPPGVIHAAWIKEQSNFSAPKFTSRAFVR